MPWRRRKEVATPTTIVRPPEPLEPITLRELELERQDFETIVRRTLDLLSDSVLNRLVTPSQRRQTADQRLSSAVTRYERALRRPRDT